MDTIPYEIDNRVNLNHFGASDFRTREVKEAYGFFIQGAIVRVDLSNNSNITNCFGFKKATAFTFFGCWFGELSVRIASRTTNNSRLT
jgi:hypothetical protein